MGLTEKYRPRTLDEVAGQQDVIEKLRDKVGNRPENIPDFLFFGRAGVGKTTTAYALANELNAKIIETNASEDRGVEVIRDKIIPMMRYSFGGHRIIFMDEADLLTSEAQATLRRPLEKYEKTTVIFSVNYKDKLINPLVSRCKDYEFSPVSDGAMKERLHYIAEEENFQEVDLDEIINNSNGDMRKAIQKLEDSNVKSKTNIVDTEVKEMAKSLEL